MFVHVIFYHIRTMPLYYFPYSHERENTAVYSFGIWTATIVTAFLYFVLV